MKEKLIAAVLAVSMLAAGTGAAVLAEQEEEINIQLTVGEAGAVINGQEQEAEAAYLTEDGVTMVPLRVLTEAFGAVVEWEEESRTITVAYKDVIVTMTVGDIYAQVNDHTQQMPAAPAVSEAGVTMIPLRFLAETLGAEVAYEDGVIHITKTDIEQGNTVQHQINTPRFGDSKVGWSMDVASDYSLTSEANGAAVFTAKNYNAYYRVSSVDKEEGFDLEKRFTYRKLLADQNNIITQAVLETDPSGVQYYKLSTKSSVNRQFEWVYETKDHLIVVSAQVGIAQEDHSAEVETILNSFQLAFGKTEETYDLYKKPTELTRIDNDDYGITLEIPSSWQKTEKIYMNKANELSFAPVDLNDQSSGGIKVYSKTNGQSAQDLAELYYDRFKECYNPDLVQVGEITQEQVSGYDGYTCTATIRGSHNVDGTMKIATVEVGDYIYFVYLRLMDQTLDGKTPEGHEQMKRIFDTFEMQQLDRAVYGDLLYIDDGHEFDDIYETSGWRITAPLSWSQDYLSSAFMLVENNTGNAVIFREGKSLGIRSEEDFRDYVKEILEDRDGDEEYRTVDPGSTKKTGAREYYSAEYYYQPEGGAAVYNRIYGFLHNKKIYMFIVQSYEEYSGGRTDQEAQRIMDSLEFLK